MTQPQQTTERPERWWIVDPSEHRRFAQANQGEPPEWLKELNVAVITVPAPEDATTWDCDFCNAAVEIFQPDGITPKVVPMLTSHALCLRCYREECTRAGLNPLATADWSLAFCACPPCGLRILAITNPEQVHG